MFPKKLTIIFRDHLQGKGFPQIIFVDGEQRSIAATVEYRYWVDDEPFGQKVYFPENVPSLDAFKAAVSLLIDEAVEGYESIIREKEEESHGQ